MRLHLYVDGFNLYYGALKKTPFKWLNLEKLAQLLFPKDHIEKIKYFTAPVKIRPNDPDHDKPNRQQIYLRALRTITNLEIIEGSFLSNQVMMKRADQGGYVKVIKTEEKGTDVNIASHLLFDAFNGSFEIAVVISNDSDLVEPVKMVVEKLKKPVIVVSPFQYNSIELKKIASSVRQIRKGVLQTSQFPESIEDAIGIFNKPVNW